MAIARWMNQRNWNRYIERARLAHPTFSAGGWHVVLVADVSKSGGFA
jgi:hypothetical protein